MYKDPAPEWAWWFQGLATEMKVVAKDQELSERGHQMAGYWWSSCRDICLDFE